MYNFRILIQEIQLLRGSFRICVLIAHGSACPGTSTRTKRLGRWAGPQGPSAGRSVSSSQPLSGLEAASSQGRTLCPNQTRRFFYQACFPARTLFGGDFLKKRAKRNSGRRLPAPGWQLREVRLWKVAGSMSPSAEENSNAQRPSIHRGNK